MPQKRGRARFDLWLKSPASPDPEYSIRPPPSDTANDMSDAWLSNSEDSQKLDKIGISGGVEDDEAGVDREPVASDRR